MLAPTFPSRCNLSIGRQWPRRSPHSLHFRMQLEASKTSSAGSEMHIEEEEEETNAEATSRRTREHESPNFTFPLTQPEGLPLPAGNDLRARGRSVGFLGLERATLMPRGKARVFHTRRLARTGTPLLARQSCWLDLCPECVSSSSREVRRQESSRVSWSTPRACLC